VPAAEQAHVTVTDHPTAAWTAQKLREAFSWTVLNSTTITGIMIRIFVVDDHPIIRQGICHILSNESDMVVVAEAATGGDALRIGSGLDYDVVVLDLTMPDLSGIDVLKTLKRLHPSKPVLAMTHKVSAHGIWRLILTMDSPAKMEARALRAGASRIISKEHVPQLLVSAIRQVVESNAQTPADSTSENQRKDLK
jgi:DNA-binding NarL/FixJ family response regulator